MASIDYTYTDLSEEEILEHKSRMQEILDREKRETKERLSKKHAWVGGVL